MKILIVDDYERKVENIKDTIKSAYGGSDLKINVSKNIHDASRKIVQDKYDLVILDINIPIAKGKNPQKDGGIRLLENIRRDKKIIRPDRLVGLTGYSDCFSRFEDEFKKDGYNLINYSNSSTDWQRPLGNIINQINEQNPSIRKNKLEANSNCINSAILIAVTIVMICSIFLPIAYTPTQRTMLFFVSSILLAILFSKNAQSKFQLKLPGFIFSTAGAAGLVMGSVFLLHYLASPGISIGVYEIYDESGKKHEIKQDEIRIPVGFNAKTPEIFIKNNSLVVIFPKGHEMVTVEINDYSGNLRYTVNKKQKIVLGKDLISSE